MKIKLAVLEQNENYLNKLILAFETKYADKFEIYSFTDLQMALAALQTSRIDVFLADERFKLNREQIPKRCGFAYLVEEPGIETYKEEHAICKFQKVDLIYKQVLSIFAEGNETVKFSFAGEKNTKVIAFFSVGGGAGASTVAAATAMHFAKAGKKTLYLDLETFGTVDLFFSGEGNFDMSDVIFALKSKNANLPLKLESCVKQDASGVFFFSEAKVALDMREMTSDDKLRLLTELKLSDAYDYILMDVDFSLDADALLVYRQAQSIVWVGDGSRVSNSKLRSAYQALSILEEENAELQRRSVLIYNKFSNKTGAALENVELKCIGGAPRFDHAGTLQVAQELSKMNMFDKLL